MTATVRAPLRLLLASVLLAGCQTFSHEPPKVPAVLDSLFVTCLPADGAASLQVLEEDRAVGALDGEWIARDTGDWEIQLTDPLGHKLLTLKHHGEQIASSGKLADRLPPMKVRGNGYLDVSGHLVAVKAAEVPCILGHGFPREWLKDLKDVSHHAEATVFFFENTVRSVELTVQGLQSKDDDGACAVIRWRKFLFLHNELTWCQTVSGHPSTRLTGYQDYLLKWIKIDDQPR